LVTDNVFSLLPRLIFKPHCSSRLSTLRRFIAIPFCQSSNRRRLIASSNSLRLGGLAIVSSSFLASFFVYAFESKGVGRGALLLYGFTRRLRLGSLGSLNGSPLIV